MIHARLINLLNNNPKLLNYTNTSICVLDAIGKSNPRSIVVPSFTYSFATNLNFSIGGSKSEVGRFSEEVRLQCAPELRTLDPIFSVIDVDNFGWVDDKWNTDAFGVRSIWENWDKCNGIVLNIDLPEIVSTQIHYIEKISQAPYRFNKVFIGKVHDSENNKSKVKYNYFVRDLRQNFSWNRDKIYSLLKDNNLVFSSIWNGVPVCWFRANDLKKVLQPIMVSNPYYFLSLDNK